MAIVSVIVPVYNMETYLRRCIDSILNQTFSDFELILVDDGSTDESGAICDEYSVRDDRVKTFHKENGGVSSARNLGLTVSSGEFVTFCDSDDYLLPFYLKDMIDAQSEYGVDLVFAGHEFGKYDTVFRPVKISEKSWKLEELEEKIIFYYKTPGWEVWATLFRTEIIHKYGIEFCTSCGNYAEDMGFVFDYILYADSARSIDSCGYRYIMHSGSMMDQSRNIPKVDFVNEVSYFFGKRFLEKYGDLNSFSVIFWRIIAVEYRKVRLKHDDIIQIRKTIRNIEWHDRCLKAVAKNYQLYRRLLGRKWAIDAYIDSRFYLGKARLSHWILEKIKNLNHKRKAYVCSLSLSKSIVT